MRVHTVCRLCFAQILRAAVVIVGGLGGIVCRHGEIFWSERRRADPTQAANLRCNWQTTEGFVRNQRSVFFPIITLTATPLRSHKFFRSPSVEAFACFSRVRKTCRINPVVGRVTAVLNWIVSSKRVDLDYFRDSGESSNYRKQE